MFICLFLLHNRKLCRTQRRQGGSPEGSWLLVSIRPKTTRSSSKRQFIPKAVRPKKYLNPKTNLVTQIHHSHKLIHTCMQIYPDNTERFDEMDKSPLSASNAQHIQSVRAINAQNFLLCACLLYFQQQKTFLDLTKLEM